MTADRARLIRHAIAALAAGYEPWLRMGDVTGPCPIYDALVRERDTGRDASGRFVRRSA